MKELPQDRSSKLHNPEIQDNLKENAEFFKELEKEYVELIKYLRETIIDLETTTDRLDDMKKHNEFIDKMSLDKDITVSKEIQYSDEDILEMEKEIKDILNHIGEIKNYIEEYNLLKLSVGSINDRLNNLEKEFKGIILKIKPEQRQ